MVVRKHVAEKAKAGAIGLTDDVKGTMTSLAIYLWRKDQRVKVL